MEIWQYIGGLVFAAVVGGFVKEKFFASPASVVARINTLEKQVAVMQETKLTEPQVRTIIHEQLQPLMMAITSMQQEQVKQGNVITRIDERLQEIKK